MFRKILIVLGAAVLLLLVVVVARPGAYRIERRARLDVPPAVAFAPVADFRRWAEWSPWNRLDPNMKVEIAGTPGAVGSSYHWSGNEKIGEGRMTIVELRPPEEIVIRLEFIKPWAQVSENRFVVKPDGAGSTVDWAMTGAFDFFGKLFSLFGDIDAQVGPEFARGLEKLKEVAEADLKAGRVAAPPAEAGGATVKAP